MPKWDDAICNGCHRPIHQSVPQPSDDYKPCKYVETFVNHYLRALTSLRIWSRASRAGTIHGLISAINNSKLDKCDIILCYSCSLENMEEIVRQSTASLKEDIADLSTSMCLVGVAAAVIHSTGRAVSMATSLPDNRTCPWFK